MNTNNIYVPIKDTQIRSTIHKPPDAKVIVLVSHGPGSGRFNLRNRQLAEQLYSAGYATLLVDWNKIKEMEERNGDFDQMKMAQTIGRIIYWLKNNRTLKDLSTVVHGSNTGAGAALIAASEVSDSIQAVISKNGRLELTEPHIERIKTPTFVAVGKNDRHLLEQNMDVYKKLKCPKSMVIIPGISPFFEEPKKVEKVGRMSIDWIDTYVIQKRSVPVVTNYQHS